MNISLLFTIGMVAVWGYILITWWQMLKVVKQKNAELDTSLKVLDDITATGQEIINKLRVEGKSEIIPSFLKEVAEKDIVDDIAIKSMKAYLNREY